MVLTEYREDHVRYIRLCVLVIVKGREALQDFLQKRLQKQYGRARPFSEILDESQIKRTLGGLDIWTEEHRNLLYPNNKPGDKDSAGEWLGRPKSDISTKDLDINLLYIFLRYFSELMSPDRNIWKNPWPGDNRPEACIARIRVYRNKLAYNSTGMISQKEFDELWNDRVSDLGTLSQTYAPQYFEALSSVQIVVYPNRKQIEGILKTMKSMHSSVYEEIRDLEMELERLFESLSLSQAPKLVHVIDSIRKKDRPRERPQITIPKKSKWNKIKLATLEQIEGKDSLQSEHAAKRIPSSTAKTDSSELSSATPVVKPANTEPTVEIHPQPVEAAVVIEETKLSEPVREDEEASTSPKTCNVYDSAQIEASEITLSVPKESSDIVSDTSKVEVSSSDREPLVDIEKADDSDEDRKSHRKAFKLVNVLRNMISLRDELDQSQEKINSILKRTTSEESRETTSKDGKRMPSSIENSDHNPEISSDANPKSSENSDTLPEANKPLESVSTRKKRIGAMGKATGVGQLLRQIHTSGMKITTSPDNSPVMTRKVKEIENSAPEIEVVKNSPDNEKGDSSDDDQWDSDDGTHLFRKQDKRGFGAGTDILFLGGMDRDSRKYGGYGRNHFGFSMGAGMHHAALRPGVHAGAYGYGRGRLTKVERHGTKYRSRSSAHSGRRGRGARGGLI